MANVQKKIILRGCLFSHSNATVAPHREVTVTQNVTKAVYNMYNNDRDMSSTANFISFRKACDCMASSKSDDGACCSTRTAPPRQFPHFSCRPPHRHFFDLHSFPLDFAHNGPQIFQFLLLPIVLVIGFRQLLSPICPSSGSKRPPVEDTERQGMVSATCAQNILYSTTRYTKGTNCKIFHNR